MTNNFEVTRMGGRVECIPFSSLGGDFDRFGRYYWAGLRAYLTLTGECADLCDEPDEVVDFFNSHRAPFWSVRYVDRYGDEFPATLDRDEYPLDDDSDESVYPFYDV